MTHVRLLFVLLLVFACGVAAWAPAAASSGGAPGPSMPMPPTPVPSPSTRAPSAPNVHILAPRMWASEGTYLVDQGVNPPSALPSVLSLCNPMGKWGSSIAANLRAGFTSEKAYFQENSKFGTPSQIGFVPETPDRVCVAYYVTVGHYTGDPPASMFFITARHRSGGSMYCITGIGGTLPAGAPGVSYGGGPILNPDQCAALPTFVPTSGFSSAVTSHALALPNPPAPNPGAVMAPALQKAATPYNLGLTNDLSVCTQHTNDQNACEFDIIEARALMVWSLGTTCGDWPTCTTHIAGYKIYNVPPGQKQRVSGPYTVAPSHSSSSTIAATLPTPTPNPMLAPHMIQLPYRVLVATVTDSDHKGGIATAAGVYATDVRPGRCYVVTAYLPNGDESDDSPQFCVAGPVKVGPQNLDLTPSALVTAYGHGSNCSDATPFAHPSGSIIAGYSVTQGTNENPSGYRCHQDEGLVKFDLSGIAPAVVYSAKLVYSKVQNYKLDGSVDPGPGVCVQIIYDTQDDWASSVSDPRAGLVTQHNQLAEVAGVSPYSVDVTSEVNGMLQSGVNNGFVIRTTDWNGPGSYCFTSFNDFHLIVTAFGSH